MDTPWSTRRHPRARPDRGSSARPGRRGGRLTDTDIDDDDRSEHPDLVEEQQHLDHAYACLADMRDRTARAAALSENAATAVDSALAQRHLNKRLSTLDTGVAALMFGRLDSEQDETWYVGRRHVEDGAGDPVVVDWRAAVATPFYRATVRDPMDLRRRRRFSVEERRLLALHDEAFDDPDGVHAGGGIPDPLLAELERSRTGELRDIVATIQAEQDVVIRAPLETCLVVQGGPGTGKTAVGLHRAAFLLYEHRELLEDRRVLVVGPNRVFLRYISQVLPSLGETAVTQATVDSLAGGGGRYRLGDDDASPAAAVKGDHRMADVVRRASLDLLGPPAEDVTLRLAWGHVTGTADEIAEMIDDVVARDLTYTGGRDALRRRVEQLVIARIRDRRHGDRAIDDEVARDLRTNRDHQSLLSKVCPTTSAPSLLRRILGNKRALARAARGILDDGEQQAIGRRVAPRLDDQRWTLAELPLLDEAEAVLNGQAVTYGHVVVDEAQDLTDMALRMLARRCPSGSMTVLGDLAQATAVGSQRSWDRVVELLAPPVTATIEELELGYRVPAPILDFATRLLPVAAPGVRASRSVRTAGEPPAVVRADAGALADRVAEAVGVLGARFGSLGVVAAGPHVPDVVAALGRAGIAHGEGLRVGLGERITVLPAPSAKGLEFDAVVVVEPAAFIDAHDHGARLLYVALTRAVQHLTVVHERDLPAPLAA